MIRKETVHIIWVTIQAGLVMLLLGACSTTKHLPEGEILYTGSKTIVENEPQAPLTEDALTELDAALDKAPSTKILGFVPIPFKMWAYNSLVRYKKGFGHWPLQPVCRQSSRVHFYGQSGNTCQSRHQPVTRLWLL